MTDWRHTDSNIGGAADAVDRDYAAHQRAVARMARIDDLPPSLRECVHEYGWTIVNAFLQAGVRKAKHIHHVIATVRKGSVEIGKRS